MPAIKRVGDMFFNVNSFDQLVQLATRRGVVEQKAQRRTAEPLAMVNGGRWLFLCPVCNNGVPCDPDWPQTICIDCGTVFAPQFPDDWQAIEQALVERPVANQNWLPGESLELLLEDNRTHMEVS